MILGGLDVRASLEEFVLALSNVPVALLLGHLSVGVLDGPLHVDAGLSVAALRLAEKVREVSLLVVVHLISESLLILVELALANLLIDPVPLL